MRCTATRLVFLLFVATLMSQWLTPMPQARAVDDFPLPPPLEAATDSAPLAETPAPDLTPPPAEEEPPEQTAPLAEEPAAEPTVELWLISTRHLPCNPCCRESKRDGLAFRYWRHDGDCRWIESDAETFQSSSAPIATLVPGAPATLYETKKIGKQVYDCLLPYLPEDRSLRFVIWTWPTDRDYLIRLRDMRIKAGTAQAQGFYLAHFIDTQPDDVPVGLLGYSFGGRVTTAALHLLGGGRIQGCGGFVNRRSTEGSVKAVLTAAAIDDWWLCSDGRHCRALPYADLILNTYNRCDPLLKRYHLLYGLRRGPCAIGYVGAPMDCFGEHAAKFEQVNVTKWVGESHHPHAYLSPEYLGLIAPPFLSLSEEMVTQ